MNKLSIALVAAGITLGLGGAYAQNQPSQPSQSTQQGATQGNEPGAGAKHGSNEGGSDRSPTAEQPTGAPQTGNAAGAAPAHPGSKETQQGAAQSQKNAGQTSSDAAQDGAVPPGADAAARTTQGRERGTGVNPGSNEGGSDRSPTAEQPTGAPGTGDIQGKPSSDKRNQGDSSATNSGQPQDSGSSSSKPSAR